MQVFKFGGASVKDADAVKNVAKIIRHFADEPTIVVVSAMGKTTNKLEEVVKAYYFKTPELNTHIEDLKAYHFSILKQLITDENHPAYNTLENVFLELNWATEEELSGTYHFHYDQIVSLGEILSTHIISAYLNAAGINNTWVDARGVIQTDNHYREGKVDFELSETLFKLQLQPLLTEGKLLITQGFIGGTSENYTTTLGREGSDYTASLLAYFSNAKHVTIWKDVPGVLNADPKYFRNTQKIEELTYQDAIELTYYGASVIHPKTIKPLQNKSIPLYVKSFLHPEEKGTLIHETVKRLNVTSYIFKENQLLLSIKPKDFSFIAEDNLSNIFAVLAEKNVKANTMQNSALSFSICVDYDEFKIPQLLEELQKQFRVLYNYPVQLFTVRHYNNDIIHQLTEDKIILLEQRSRTTLQMVLKDNPQ
jgi:aspartate kinase